MFEYMFYHRRVGRRGDLYRDSDRARDRLIIAEIDGVTSRHLPLSGHYPCGEEAAIAEVRSIASGRADLLAEFAGTCLGLSVSQPANQLAAQLVAQAGLAARAGADVNAIARWIPAGLARGENIRASRAPRW
jgi:hypothetical protein